MIPVANHISLNRPNAVHGAFGKDSGGIRGFWFDCVLVVLIVCAGFAAGLLAGSALRPTAGQPVTTNHLSNYTTIHGTSYRPELPSVKWAGNLVIATNDSEPSFVANVQIGLRTDGVLVWRKVTNSTGDGR